MDVQSKTEKRLQEQFNQLESEREIIRLNFEKDLRERYWRQYKGKLSPKSFSLLWSGKLRKQAVMRLLIDIETTGGKHRRKKT